MWILNIFPRDADLSLAGDHFADDAFNVFNSSSNRARYRRRNQKKRLGSVDPSLVEKISIQKILV